MGARGKYLWEKRAGGRRGSGSYKLLPCPPLFLSVFQKLEVVKFLTVHLTNKETKLLEGGVLVGGKRP